MKVVAVHPSDEMYGSDKVLLQSLKAFGNPDEIEVWIAADVNYGARPLSKELRLRGYRVRHRELPVLRRSTASVRSIPTLVRRAWQTGWELRAARPDVVYINTSALAVVAPIARLTRSRVVAHVHEYLRPGLERLLLSLGLKASRHLFIVSEGIRGSLGLGLQKSATLLYNGFDLPAALPPRSMHASDTDRVVFMLASRWNEWKGYPELLSSWAVASHAHMLLRIYGGPPASGGSVDVVGLIRALGIAASVEVVGEVEDVFACMEDVDVVLVPSVRPDPLPTIAIEAAAAGRCVIASRIGGLPEIVVDGVSGLLVEPGDKEAWVSALRTVDRKTAHEYGAAARRLYEDRFGARRYEVEFRQRVVSP